jgi:two-component system nitrogen regulation response regulator GlnG
VEAKRISDSALQQVVQFDFPGNVRQLENLCHWLTVMAPAQVIDPKDLPPEVQAHAARQSGSAGSVAGVPSAVSGAGDHVGSTLSASMGSAAATGGHEALLGTGSVSHEGSLGAPAFAAASTGAGGSGELAWIQDLERQARQLLDVGRLDVWDVLTRQFEACLIQTALHTTKGRRIEAAQRLGIGRNTITRKIQELGLE